MPLRVVPSPTGLPSKRFSHDQFCKWPHLGLPGDCLGKEERGWGGERDTGDSPSLGLYLHPRRTVANEAELGLFFPLILGDTCMSVLGSFPHPHNGGNPPSQCVFQQLNDVHNSGPQGSGPRDAPSGAGARLCPHLPSRLRRVQTPQPAAANREDVCTWTSRHHASKAPCRHHRPALQAVRAQAGLRASPPQEQPSGTRNASREAFEPSTYV